MVPSPAWPGPDTAGTGLEQAIQGRTREISKRDGGELCVLYKDLVTGIPVEKCEPLHSGEVPELAKQR